jgi:hypothetical protein
MRRAGKKNTRASNTSKDATKSAEGKDRGGIPNQASVLSEREFTSPKGRHYRIISTEETDPYDAPACPEEQCS